MRARRSAWVLLTAAALAGGAHAHHSYHMYNLQQMITLEGRVIDFEYVYPHAFVTLDVSNDEGNTAIWEVEAVSPGRLERRGVTSSSLSAGDEVRIVAYPPRNTERQMAAGNFITKADGTELSVGFLGFDLPAPRETAVATSLAGIWLAEENFAQVSFLDILGEWPLTEPGRNALDEFDGSQTPSVDCVPYPPPLTMLAPEPMVLSIDETAVTILPQSNDSERVIYTDGRPHPGVAEPSIQGHSTGYWEDGALVVDTIHFAEHESGNALGVPAGTGKHLTERFSLSEDGTTLDYSFTLEDPEFLTGPVSGSSQWTYRPDIEFELGVCNLNSARRFLEAF